MKKFLPKRVREKVLNNKIMKLSLILPLSLLALLDAVTTTHAQENFSTRTQYSAIRERNWITHVGECTWDQATGQYTLTRDVCRDDLENNVEISSNEEAFLPHWVDRYTVGDASAKKIALQNCEHARNLQKRQVSFDHRCQDLALLKYGHLGDTPSKPKMSVVFGSSDCLEKADGSGYFIQVTTCNRNQGSRREILSQKLISYPTSIFLRSMTHIACQEMALFYKESVSRFTLQNGITTIQCSSAGYP